MSTWKNTDITRKLMCANEHSDAKCELTLNDDGKHIKAANETTKDTIDQRLPWPGYDLLYCKTHSACETKCAWYPNMLETLTCLQKKDNWQKFSHLRHLTDQKN